MQIDLNKAAVALGVGASIIAMITAWNEVNFRLEKWKKNKNYI